ncbi:MAG: cupin domain-containing protein [Pseudomonadota bacterium]
MHLKTFDTDTFLRDYWQKKPLLIRNPWDRWVNPVEPDELAGLACEDDAEARLIEQTRASWKVEYGPFAEKRFAKLGKKPWTLLVQAVDHVVPDVAALIDPFRFIPNWRIDDVMVSYASDGGGVGPHFDQYDVFLIQGLGKRRWRIGQACDEASALLPHDDLRLLAGFETVDEWVLEPGDILYVPPGVAHDGVAVGDDCMTYSVGFRAPSRSELVAHWCDHVLGELAEDDRYGDAGLPVQANPGEITPAAITRLRAMITAALCDEGRFAHWFGTWNSEPKYPERDWRPEAPVTLEEVRKAITQGTAVERNPASRFAFVRNGEGLTLFVDGESFDAWDDAARFVEAISGTSQLVIDPAWSADVLVKQLVDQGSLRFDYDD